MSSKRTALDLFRALIGVIDKRNNSELLRSAGLVFDAQLSREEM